MMFINKIENADSILSFSRAIRFPLVVRDKHKQVDGNAVVVVVIVTIVIVVVVVVVVVVSNFFFCFKHRINSKD